MQVKGKVTHVLENIVVDFNLHDRKEPIFANSLGDKFCIGDKYFFVDYDRGKVSNGKCECEDQGVYLGESEHTSQVYKTPEQAEKDLFLYMEEQAVLKCEKELKMLKSNVKQWREDLCK